VAATQREAEELPDVQAIFGGAEKQEGEAMISEFGLKVKPQESFFVLFSDEISGKIPMTQESLQGV
jgi:hypothetical protein